jgi:hypothetical protein
MAEGELVTALFHLDHELSRDELLYELQQLALLQPGQLLKQLEVEPPPSDRGHHQHPSCF